MHDIDSAQLSLMQVGHKNKADTYNNIDDTRLTKAFGTSTTKFFPRAFYLPRRTSLSAPIAACCGRRWGSEQCG